MEGINVIEKTKDWIAVEKPPRLVSEACGDGKGLGDLIAAENGGYVGVIHRLDRGVGGVILYALTPEAASALSRAALEHRLEKRYLAVVEGRCEAEGELRDLLFYDRRRNKTFPVDRKRAGVKEAILRYRCLASLETEAGVRSLVEVEPVTGRTHQTRVQFASRGLPVCGDRRYGGGALDREDGGIALVCHSISVPPVCGGEACAVRFTPAGAPWDLFAPSLLV